MQERACRKGSLNLREKGVNVNLPKLSRESTQVELRIYSSWAENLLKLGWKAAVESQSVGAKAETERRLLKGGIRVPLNHILLTSVVDTSEGGSGSY